MVCVPTTRLGAAIAQCPIAIFSDVARNAYSTIPQRPCPQRMGFEARVRSAENDRQRGVSLRPDQALASPALAPVLGGEQPCAFTRWRFWEKFGDG